MTAEQRTRPKRSGSEEASAAIWPWPDRAAELRDRAKRARRTAALRAAIAGTAAGVFFAVGRPVIAGIIAALGGLTLSLALTSPLRAYAGLERGIQVISEAVGRGLSWLLLAPVYFLVMTPLGLFTRRGSRDPLSRRFEAERDTYWRPRKGRPIDRPY